MISPDAVVVSRTSMEGGDPADLVYSNVSFVNALYGAYLTDEEIAPDALVSYCVDYYLAEVLNGGFSQFVYNSHWEPRTVARIRDGLRRMGAERHLAVFEQGAVGLDGLAPDEVETFYESAYFGENATRDRLNETIDDAFTAAEDEKSLTDWNAEWLRGLPHLVVLPVPEMEAEVARRGAALPDREARIARARAAEPRYLKLIRALCERAGQELAYVTAGDPTHTHEGKQTLAWHFITDQGHHYMIEADGQALLFGDASDAPLATVDAPADA